MKNMKALVLRALVVGGVMAVAVAGDSGVEAAPVRVDEAGVRAFPAVPPPGVHPRVFITEAEKADLKRRMYDSEIGRKLIAPNILPTARQFMFEGHGRRLQEVDPDHLDEETIRQVLRGHTEGVSQYMGVVALEAWVNDDDALKERIIRAAVNQAHVILASRELRPRHRLWRGPDESGRDWDLSNEFTVGGVGLAAVYDLLYNDMTEAERATIRACISATISGRRSHGLGWPKTKLFSNWFPLHATMGVMMLAIEGEEGYDPEIYDLWLQGLTDWLDVGIGPKGANHEDGYIYYALRGGMSFFLAAQRRGDNLAHHPAFRNMLNWQAMWEPSFGGLGGYQTFHVVLHHLFPTDPVANMFWARRIGENYNNRVTWQSAFYTVLCAEDYQGTYAEAADYTQFDFPLSMFDQRRGVQIVRNGFDPKDLLFRMHARADGMFVGHAAVDSGAFELQSHGREWVHHSVGDKVDSFNSYDYSIVHVDGKAQGMKPPIVKVTDERDADAATIISTDLTYAYNWKWFYGWPIPGVEGRELPGAPWVKELEDPYELGWPAAEDWLPRDLSNQPDLGFEGLWLRKKRINDVQYAFRSAIVARGDRPYVLIVDDVKQDDQRRLYEWYLATPRDVTFAGQFQHDVILQDGRSGTSFIADPGSRRLLVRVLSPYEDLPARNPYIYNAPTHIDGVKFGTHQSVARHQEQGGNFQVGAGLFTRLDIPAYGTQGSFVVMLFPYATNVAGAQAYYNHPLGNDAMPETSWNADRTELTIRIGDQVDVFTFRQQDSGQREVGMTRNGAKVL